MDIQGYFMSIDRSLLYEMVSRVIIENSGKITGDSQTILYTIRKTIFNDPVNGCIIKSKMSEWKGLPSSKSLFYAGKNQGLPIGNLTSQLFANIYLDEFDHFMKQQLVIIPFTFLTIVNQCFEVNLQKIENEILRTMECCGDKSSGCPAERPFH